MTPNHARMLAVELVDSWQTNTIALEVWIAELDPLDYQLAATTLARLRRDQARPPSVHELHATYAAVRRATEPDIATRPDPQGIGIGEYLARLEQRAQFDPAAKVECERWQRLRARRRHPSAGGPSVIGPPT